jgi:hypothetical protein
MSLSVANIPQFDKGGSLYHATVGFGHPIFYLPHDRVDRVHCHRGSFSKGL